MRTAGKAPGLLDLHSPMLGPVTENGGPQGGDEPAELGQ